MAGRKTHEQQLRTFERKDDLPKSEDVENQETGGAAKAPNHPGARRSEMNVSFRGMNQESQHNKHNDPAAGAAKGGGKLSEDG